MRFTPDGFQVCAFWAECPDCTYRFPVAISLNDQMVAVRCTNCTNTDVVVEFAPNPLPMEIYETWKPGVLTREEKFRFRKLRERIEV